MNRHLVFEDTRILLQLMVKYILVLSLSPGIELYLVLIKTNFLLSFSLISLSGGIKPDLISS